MKKTFFVKLFNPWWVGFYQNQPLPGQLPDWDLSMEDFKRYFGTPMAEEEVKRVTIEVE
jgi:hypothetical protein